MLAADRTGRDPRHSVFMTQIETQAQAGSSDTEWHLVFQGTILGFDNVKCRRFRGMSPRAINLGRSATERLTLICPRRNGQ